MTRPLVLVALFLLGACAPAFRYAPAVAAEPREAEKLGSPKFAALWPAVRAVVGAAGAPSAAPTDAHARHLAARRSTATAAATVVSAVLRQQQRPLATAQAVLRTDKSGAWAHMVHHGGTPPTLDQLALMVMQAFYGEGITRVAVDAMRVNEANAESQGALTSVLEKGEKFAESYFVLVDFEQSALLRDGLPAGWLAVVGAYDPVAGRVLLLDPASPQLQPFWVSVGDLVAAMQRPDAETGESRGYLVVRLV